MPIERQTTRDLQRKRKHVYEQLAAASARRHDYPSPIYRAGVAARIAALEAEGARLDREIERRQGLLGHLPAAAE